MPGNGTSINFPTAGGIAPLQNVSLLQAAVDLATGRSRHLPGLVAFYGPSGYGKSFSAAWCVQKRNAYYVAARSSWTPRSLMLAVLRELGVAADAGSVAELVDIAGAELAASGRPLIIDEFDHLLKASLVELIRDLYEISGAALVIIGEEQLPAKLRRWERFHNRVLAWEPAQPCTVDDVRALHRLYCPEVRLADDLVDAIHRASRGVARRICVNLDFVRREAGRKGWAAVDAATWGRRELYTGEAPMRQRGLAPVRAVQEV